MTSLIHHLLATVALILLTTASALPQSLTTSSGDLNQQQIDFFGFLLKQIASPELSAEKRLQNEERIVKQFGLDSAEAAGLHAVATDCLNSSTQALLAARQVTGLKSELTASDQSVLKQLDAQQRSRLSHWAMTLTRQMRSATLKRFDMVILYPTNAAKP